MTLPMTCRHFSKRRLREALDRLAMTVDGIPLHIDLGVHDAHPRALYLMPVGRR